MLVSSRAAGGGWAVCAVTVEQQSPAFLAPGTVSWKTIFPQMGAGGIWFQDDSFIYSKMTIYLSNKYLFFSDYILVTVLNIEDIASHLGTDERYNA